jgi:hypothetical protein
MPDNEIAEIKTVSMREQFEHEEHNFTPWLKENIDQLSSDDLLKISFDEVDEEETVIDNKRVDLIARDLENDIEAVIENQFGESDPDHLGRSLVYASDVDANLVVWIAEDLLERHKQTIRWLNTTTDDDIFYFAIEVNLRQIGDSPYAVEFQAHERPENWEEQVKQEYLRDKEKRRLEFWQDFQQKCDARGLEGREPSKSASHGIYVFEKRKRPAYIRPTVHYDSYPKNMIRFYEDSRNILRDENKREELIRIIKETVSEADEGLTAEITDMIDIDIDDSNEFDKLIIEDDSLEHRELNDSQEVGQTLQWMVDTTLVLKEALVKLSEDEIEAETR